MKYLISIITLLICYLFPALAVPGGVEPIKIEPITKVAYGQSFYVDQAELWKQKTEENNRDAAAWLNYFQAARYANMLSDTLFKKYDLDSIVGSMPASMANTFEFNYILYAQSNWNDGRFDHLLKAHELAPDREEAFHALVTYYTTEGNVEQAAYFAKKMFDAGEFSPSILAWNYNMLASVERNAILLTHGDNDTYPAWVVQAVKNVRKDVKVLNVNLLMYDSYRDIVFSEAGLHPISSADHPAYQDMYLAIMMAFFQQSQRPVYIATSVPEFIRNAIGDSLYLVGLAFKYSPVPFDNLAFLKNNFENKFLKDHLHIQLEPDTGSNVVASMNMHYLPAIITLRHHYLENGNTERASELEPLLRQVASEAGKEENIAQYIGGLEKGKGHFMSVISVKSLQKEMVKIRGDLYAAATEVTNAQYEAFLMDLLKNKEYDLLEKCKAIKTDWRNKLPEKYRDLTDEKIFENGHPDDPNAPIQNISHEAAKEYCKWITKVYNNAEDKKKDYDHVVFRLPSEEEWEYASHGKQTAPYPWGGLFVKNAKGCYLLNMDAVEEAPCEDCPSSGSANDGSFFPVMADAYMPNDYGLYNCSGNVAEMISVKGIAKGGSWEDGHDDCKITALKKYDGPTPAIGFRVFMEVK